MNVITLVIWLLVGMVLGSWVFCWAMAEAFRRDSSHAFKVLGIPDYLEMRRALRASDEYQREILKGWGDALDANTQLVAQLLQLESNTVSFSPEGFAMVEHHARADGVPLGEWVRRAVWMEHERREFEHSQGIKRVSYADTRKVVGHEAPLRSREEERQQEAPAEEAPEACARCRDGLAEGHCAWWCPVCQAYDCCCTCHGTEAAQGYEVRAEEDGEEGTEEDDHGYDCADPFCSGGRATLEGDLCSACQGYVLQEEQDRWGNAARAAARKAEGLPPEADPD